MASFQSRNGCACVLAFVVSALMIAAVVSPWYFNHQEFTMSSAGTATGTLSTSTVTSVINSTKAFYDLDGVRVVTTVGNLETSTYSRYSSSDSKNVQTTVKVAQAFTLIALLLAFVVLTFVFIFFFERIRNKIIFAVGMTATRLTVVVLAALILVAILIAFLEFLAITSAFKDDNTDCFEGPCRKFVDSVTSDYQNGIKFENSWGPSAGWYIHAATLPVAFFLTLVLVINKFPLPIDSEASSGEAL